MRGVYVSVAGSGTSLSNVMKNRCANDVPKNAPSRAGGTTRAQKTVRSVAVVRQHTPAQTRQISHTIYSTIRPEQTYIWTRYLNIPYLTLTTDQIVLVGFLPTANISHRAPYSNNCQTEICAANFKPPFTPLNKRFFQSLAG